jgi:hypothetical protein
VLDSQFKRVGTHRPPAPSAAACLLVPSHRLPPVSPIVSRRQDFHNRRQGHALPRRCLPLATTAECAISLAALDEAEGVAVRVGHRGDARPATDVLRFTGERGSGL